jgi:Spy/CpxP family protein refolding chaperone
MKKKLLGLAAASLLLTGLSTSSMAYTETYIYTTTAAVNPERALHRLSQYLELTRPQRRHIHNIMIETNDKMATLRTQILKNQEYLDTLRGPNYNHKQLDTYSAREGTLIAQMLKLKGDANHKIYIQLDPDQKLALAHLKNVMRSGIY